MDTVSALDWATFGVALGSLIVLFVVMVFQIKVFAQVRQANTFSTLTAVHETLADDDRIALRRYIVSDLRPHLNSAVSSVFGSPYVVDNGEDRVDVPKVLSELARDQDKLHQFTRALSAQTTGLPLVGAMDAVERVLNDFDLLAIPVFLGIEHTEKAAEAYRAPLESTARELLPYVAIQRRLRGDPSYRNHYTYLLKRLNVDTMGL